MENLQTLQQLCRALSNKRPWKKTIILLHDSARPKTSSVHGQVLDEVLKRIHHPHYKFDLAFILQSVRVCKGSHAWPSTVHIELLKRGYVAKGMFRRLEWWQIFIDWD
jgi:hypothetical protein